MQPKGAFLFFLLGVDGNAGLRVNIGDHNPSEPRMTHAHQNESANPSGKNVDEKTWKRRRGEDEDERANTKRQREVGWISSAWGWNGNQKAMESCENVVIELEQECERQKISDCHNFVYNLWQGKETGPDAYKFLSSLDALATFWAGYSHRLGTRDILDDLVIELSGKRYELQCPPFQIHDIEHESHPIGKIMRKLAWARDCHMSKADTNLWKGLSEAFANGVTANADAARETFERFSKYNLNSHNAVQELISFKTNHSFSISEDDRKMVKLSESTRKFDALVEKRKTRESCLRHVFVIVNYEIERFRSSFLFKYELPLLRSFQKVHVVDFRNCCHESFLQAIANQITMTKDESPVIVCYHGNLVTSLPRPESQKHLEDAIPDVDKIIPMLSLYDAWIARKEGRDRADCGQQEGAWITH